MSDPEHKPEKGQRVGAHPLLVIFGVIIGLWLFTQAIIPKSKNIQPPQGSETTPHETALLLEETDPTFVPSFKISTTIPDMNAVGILVPPQTTESQVIALIKFLRESRRNSTLSSVIPPTTPGGELGEFGIADVYIFSEAEYAVMEAVRILAIGAHTPGEFYSSSIPYEVAMEHVRGHYTVNLNDKVTPEKATLGFGEEATGLYSKKYRVVF